MTRENEHINFKVFLQKLHVTSSLTEALICIINLNYLIPLKTRNTREMAELTRKGVNSASHPSLPDLDGSDPGLLKSKTRLKGIGGRARSLLATTSMGCELGAAQVVRDRGGWDRKPTLHHAPPPPRKIHLQRWRQPPPSPVRAGKGFELRMSSSGSSST